VPRLFPSRLPPRSIDAVVCAGDSDLDWSEGRDGQGLAAHSQTHIGFGGTAGIGIRLNAKIVGTGEVGEFATGDEFGNPQGVSGLDGLDVRFDGGVELLLCRIEGFDLGSGQGNLRGIFRCLVRGVDRLTVQLLIGRGQKRTGHCGISPHDFCSCCVHSGVIMGLSAERVRELRAKRYLLSARTLPFHVQRFA